MTDGEVAPDSAAFTHLGEQVRAALSDRGFSTPTEPQRRAIPPLAAGENSLVIAPTGTGKTETAMLPVFDAIVQRRAETPEEAGDPYPGFAALYITPLRALNRDMRERLEWWGKQLDVSVDVRHGDTTDYQRSKQANNPPDVLVTTPETLQAMFTGSKLRAGLESVDHLVVDEVHELAASKRGAQLSIAMERLREVAGPFQRIGLSATVGEPEAIAQFLTGGRKCAIRGVDVGSRIDIDVESPEVRPVDERLAGELMTAEDVASHVRRIVELVEAHESTLIFVNTRQTAEALGSRFKALGPDGDVSALDTTATIGVHHGSLSKAARIEVEDRFKSGEIDALLCTSSMELGIDVGHVDHVVQYSSPRQVSRLLQRVGRAGHRRDQVSSGTVVTTRPDDTFEALAIARRAKAGEVEHAPIHEGSLDAVANQVVALAMGHEEIPVEDAYEIVSRSYPFRELAEETFLAIVEELAGNRVIWHAEEKDRIEKTGGTWQYVYANLSMIPDEETYEVHDVASGRQIGTLDERFVVNFAQQGEVFIQRGEMWRITDIDDEESEVKVSPIEDPAGEVPSWIGQEIPVPEAVAGEVGEMRRVAEPQFAGGADIERVAGEFTNRYPTDENTASEALTQLQRHAETEHPMPTDDRLVVEREGRTIVVNAAFGHRANETLGRVLSSLLGQRTGSSIALDVDTYRIELETPGRVDVTEVVEVLETTDPDHVEAIIELSLKRSDTLKFRLAQVAEQFGRIKRWQGDASVSSGRLLAALEDTPVYDEAVREVFHEDLDVDAASDVLAAIQRGELETEIVGGRTPVGTGGRSSGTELLSPENADASVIDTVRERIQDDRVILLCLHCTEWKTEKPVRRVRDQPQCPECGSTRIAALNPWADEVVQAVRAQQKDEEQDSQTKRAFRAGSLVQTHGKQAVIALAARGVGPHNAARIINRLREDEDEFYRDILEQERQYARTQSFWD
jgi:ATP-dependent Lhr-like helicase